MQTKTMLALSDALSSLELAAGLLHRETTAIVGSGDHIELIRHYYQMREANSAIKKAREMLDNLEDHLSHKDIPDAFKRVGVKTITIEDVGRVTVSYKWGCSMADGKKPESLQWLRNSGNGGIIIETVNAQTLAAFAKNEVETHGKTLPDDLFTTSLRPYTSITKV